MTTKECLEVMLRPMADVFSPEFAQRLVDLRAAPELQLRMDQLAEKANEGELTDDERSDYKSMIDAASLLAVMQAQARRYLSQHAA
jgi:hypothetical protein